MIKDKFGRTWIGIAVDICVEILGALILIGFLVSIVWCALVVFGIA